MQASKSDRKAAGQAKAKNPSRTKSKSSRSASKNSDRSTKERGRAAAYAAVPKSLGNIGMQDLIAHRFSYIAGYTYIGNGVLGASNSVYYRTPDAGTYTVVGTVPILPMDTQLGASYVRDIGKYFSRIRYREIGVTAVSLLPTTSKSLTVVMAPVRGSGNPWALTANTNTTAALTFENVVTSTGEKPFASYESKRINVTPFIAGGSGARQNEFSIAGTENTTSELGAAGNLNGVCPACIQIAGVNSDVTTASQVHAIVVDCVVDFLDFFGSKGVTNPVGFAPFHVKSILDHLNEEQARRETGKPDAREELRSKLVGAGRFDLVDKLDGAYPPTVIPNYTKKP